MVYTSNYVEEINSFISQNDMSILDNSRILVTGGTGLICSYLIDAVLETNMNCNITLLCSDITRARNRFLMHNNDSRIEFIKADLTKSLEVSDDYDYILSGASYTDPKNYGLYPVETITTNILGNYNLFEVARKQKSLKRFLVFSSCEVYGEETNLLRETTKGIVDCLNVRSCYNESKRVVETMAVSYSREYGINTVIGRFSRVYGPTMKLSDTKALSQFMFNAIANEDIVLKSKGTQKFSYCYVSDAASAIIRLLESGESANAYNVTNDTEVLELREIASLIANSANVKVKFEIPPESEQRGYSLATFAIQDATKMRSLGWEPRISLKDGVFKTLSILKERVELEQR